LAFRAPVLTKKKKTSDANTKLPKNRAEKAKEVEKEAPMVRIGGDPLILSSVKMNLGFKNDSEGPTAVSRRLSEAMGRDVHFSDMNLAPVPRDGVFPMLQIFNGADEFLGGFLVLRSYGLEEAAVCDRKGRVLLLVIACAARDIDL